jgi:hypothetical protein
MENEKLEKLILDLICTSKLESNFDGKRPSLNQAAIIYAETKDIFSEKKYQYLKNFDGFDSTNLEELKRSLLSTKNIIKRNSEKLENFKPDVEQLTYYRIRIENLNSLKFQSYCKAYNNSISKNHRRSVNVIDIPAEVTSSIKKPLLTLAKAIIKSDVIKTVIEEIELEEKFTLRKEFESIPDACRFFESESGQNLTREKLKNWFKKYVLISQNGEELEWEIINKRINAWVDHENNKPNKKTIPHT